MAKEGAKKPATKVQPEKRGKGRPTLYKPEYVGMVEKMATFGLTDAQMANVFNVTVETLHQWRHRYPDFAEANARGKPDPDSQVEASLFQMAIGGHKIKEVIRDGEGNIVQTKIKQVAPDPHAAMKWLFNRRPKQWRERIEHEIELTDLSSEMTTEQKKKRIAELLAKRSDDTQESK